MHILVTGGAGFIGSHLIKKLCAQDHKVDAIDNFSAGDITKRREKDIEKAKNAEVWKSDARDTKVVLYHLRKRNNIADDIPALDAIIHLAAPISVAESIIDPKKYCNEIHRNTINVLQAAVDEKVKKVIIASTAAVYGSPERMPVSEHTKPDPLSEYAASKLAAEHSAKIFSREQGIETAILRFFNVYGPDQDPASSYAGVITKFMQCAKTKTQPVIYGDGKQTRDFVYVEDVVDAIITATTKKIEQGIVLNIGSGTAVSINELWQKITTIAKWPGKPKYEDAKKGEVQNSQAEITKAKKNIGYEPKTSLEDGLKKTWEWYNNNK